jgi:hypothetical protein
VKKKLTRIGIALASVVAIALGTVTPALAATTADVTVTATPTYIALTNSEATWAVGTVAASTTYWWTADSNAPDPTSPTEAADMKSTITNTGSVAEDIDIKVAAFTGGTGWTISTDDSPAEGEIAILAVVTGGDTASMTQVITTDSELTGSLASSGTIKWSMKMITPASFTDGVEKSGTVTLTATQDA